MNSKSARGNWPTIGGWARIHKVSIPVVLEMFRTGTAPKRLGMARRGLHGEPELLRAWAKRNEVPYRLARELFRQDALPSGIAHTKTSPQLEWFQSTPGIQHVLHEQAEHGHAIIALVRIGDRYLQRLKHWTERYQILTRQLETHRTKLRSLYAKHWQLRNTIKRAEDAYRRGEIPLTLSDMDDLKQRLFGADLVALEMAARRKRWRKYRGPKTPVPQLRQEDKTDA